MENIKKTVTHIHRKWRHTIHVFWTSFSYLLKYIYIDEFTHLTKIK